MKQFTTLDEIISDDVFTEEVKKEIANFRKNRATRKPAPDGMKYKRDWLDAMVDDGQLNADFFISNIKLIWERCSSLPSVKRTVIRNVCDNAVLRMLEYYKEPETVVNESN